MQGGMRGDRTKALRYTLLCPSSLVDLEIGRPGPDRASTVTQFARTGPAAPQSDPGGDSAEGVVAWMSARKSAWSFAWLSVQCVRRRRRSSRGTSPVT